MNVTIVHTPDTDGERQVDFFKGVASLEHYGPDELRVDFMGSASYTVITGISNVMVHGFAEERRIFKQ